MSFADNSEQDQKAGDQSDNNKSEGDKGDQPFFTLGDRVYKTEDDLKKAMTNANEHINTIEGENKQYKDSASQSAHNEGQKELARQVLEGIKEQNRNTDQTDQQSKVGLNEDDIAKIVIKQLKVSNSETAKDANMNSCMDSAEKVYGEKYLIKVGERAKELDMSMDDVDKLAENNPNAFKSLFIPKSDTRSDTSFSANSDQSSEGRQFGDGGSDEKKSYSIKGKTASQLKSQAHALGEEYDLY